MNKTFCKKKYFIILLIAGCLILFNSGCGLDVFYVIEAPNRVISEPIYTNQSQDQQYFEFPPGFSRDQAIPSRAQLPFYQGDSQRRELRHSPQRGQDSEGVPVHGRRR